MAFADAQPGRVYPKAPIVEAVIDIQVSQEEPLHLDGCSAALASSFPNSSPIHVFEMKMDVGAQELGSSKSLVGQRLVNEAGNRILQLQQRGFTYSHLPPYTEWPVFRAEAMPLWASFVKGCLPKRVNRVALRFINRLKLPLGKIDLKDFLKIYPEVPDEMPSVSGLLMQIQMGHQGVATTCRSVITIASEQASDPSFQPIVLDLDVYAEVDLPSDSPEIWSILDTLRIKKNQLFESALTEETKRGFL